jgi:hypothetical protein
LHRFQSPTLCSDVKYQFYLNVVLSQQRYTHIPSVCLSSKSWNLIGNHSLWATATPVQPCDAHLNILCEGLCCLFKKSVLIQHFCFSILWYSGERYWVGWFCFLFVNFQNCRTALYVKYLCAFEFKPKKETA